MILNINKIYLYMFPVFLAFMYPRILVEYTQDMAYMMTILASLVLVKNIQKIRFLKFFALAVVLIITILVHTINFEIWTTTRQPYYLFSSLMYIPVFLNFLEKYSINQKKQYLNFLLFMIVFFMLFPIYNYISRPHYPGGNGMMYHIVGMYMIYMALKLRISENDVHKRTSMWLIFFILAFDLMVAKTRGIFPLIVSLIFFNVYTYKHIFSEKLKNIGFLNYVFVYVFLLIIGLLPIAILFGYGDFLLQVFVTRSSNYSIDATTGRPYLLLQWGDYFVQTMLYQLKVDLPDGLGVHNTFFHLLLRYGWLGFAIYFISIGYLLNRTMKLRMHRMAKIPLYLMIASSIMLLNTATLFFDNDMSIWIGLYLLFTVLLWKKNKDPGK